ncbi:MAG TPA: DUF5672 family protein [Thermoanaerobaculia bacterium]|jgi:hypothetical protein
MSTLSNPSSVAVVVPIYRCELTAEERQSLRHLDAYLSGYDRCFAAPERVRPRRPGFALVHFPDACFASVESYSRLLLSAAFYRAFAAYEHVLVHQLDALVLAADLERWCAAPYDYVGAPWLKDPRAPEKGFSRVGNGGLSLRRVDACLRVLETRRYLGGGPSLARDLVSAALPDLAWHRFARRLRVLREARRGAAWYASRYTVNEDRFWSDRAALFDPAFRVASVAAALGFSFERAPRYCYEANGGALPFGCHAWSRWDRAFWEPYLLAGAGEADSSG